MQCGYPPSGVQQGLRSKPCCTSGHTALRRTQRLAAALHSKVRFPRRKEGHCVSTQETQRPSESDLERPTESSDARPLEDADASPQTDKAHSKMRFPRRKEGHCVSTQETQRPSESDLERPTESSDVKDGCVYVRSMRGSHHVLIHGIHSKGWPCLPVPLRH